MKFFRPIYLGIFLFFIFSSTLFFSSTSTFAKDYYYGLDVSSYQGDIDFSSVYESGYEAVYIRVGEGFNFVDSNFEENYKSAQKAGLYYGFYYYVTAASTSEATTQATTFANLISDIDYTLRPAMDFEFFDDISTSKSNLIALSFLTTLEDLTNITPAIYSDAYNVETRWDSDLSKFPLWVAAYENLSTPKDYILPSNSVWETWSCYQYSDSLKIDGISDSVDGDVFTSDLLINDSNTDTTSSNLSNKKYIIQKGDTLWSISNYYDVSISSLVVLNNISDENLIYTGESLSIPTTSSISYTVSYGDTLYAIATKFNSTVEDIAKLNNIENINLIYAGEILTIN